MKSSKILYRSYLPQKFSTGVDFKDCLLIFDRILSDKYPDWISLFPNQLAAESGESLKELKKFPEYMAKIQKLTLGIPREKLTVVGFGGGSVGDFSGFVASIVKRGVRLIHIPSTWLSAMDSAHGGKTAMNIGSIKNQIGTFYPADIIYLVKEVLLAQPKERVTEAAGEYFKMALISGGALWKDCLKNSPLTAPRLWRDLPKVIAGKLKVVKLDPYETKGLRHVLNLGHTVGHVLESQLALPHGLAVHLGLRFSLQWGIRKRILKMPIPDWVLPPGSDLKKYLQKVTDPKMILIQDKKVSNKNEIRFVFLEKPGKPAVKKVKIEELVTEWERQGC